MPVAVPLRPVRIAPVLPLTRRQLEILSLMARGLSNSAICTELWLSPKTVETHIGGIYANLGLAEEPGSHRRVQAVLCYLQAMGRARQPPPVARAA